MGSPTMAFSVASASLRLGLCAVVLVLLPSDLRAEVVEQVGDALEANEAEILPVPSRCCKEKMVPKPSGLYGRYKLAGSDGEATKKFGCEDACVYIRESDGGKYCFAEDEKEGFDVKCEDEPGETNMTRPPKPPP